MRAHRRPAGRARPAGAAVAALLVIVAVAVAACGAPAGSGAAGSAASPSDRPAAPSPSDSPPGAPSAAGPDWLASGGSGDPASCATPAPSEPAAICTDPSATAVSALPSAATAAASAAPAPTASPTPASPTPASSPMPSVAASASAAASASPTTPAATPSPAASAAPTSAAGFRVRDTIVPVAFPLPATASYRYGDGWRAPRVGVARPYNQIRGIAPDGSYLRAHDGVDLLVKLGTPVLAPFAGRVVDPAKRWKPWDPSRYGKVVVIESTEPGSTGYTMILAHLSSTRVAVGDAVDRGQVVGKTGKTGNAAGTPPHLHLEIRAPFLIRYGYAKVIRKLDVFDAEPSLRAADPKAR